MDRRQVLKLLGAGGVVLGAGGLAQAYPTRNVTIIVPYAAGTTDQFARILGAELARRLGKPFLVETRPGGGGSVGTGFVAKNAKPDGHTLLFAVSAVQTVAPHQNKLPYGFADLRPIARVSVGPNVLAARPGAPFKTAKELVDYARANPKKVTYASAGTGSTTHLTGEAIARAAGVSFTHIPFAGVTPAVTAAVGGNVDLVVGFAQAIMPQVEGKRLVVLGQLGATRTKVLPNVPTLKEGGIDLVMPANTGFWSPSATPEDVSLKLEAAIREAVESPEIAELGRKTQTELDFAGSADFRAELEREDKFQKELLTALGMIR